MHRLMTWRRTSSMAALVMRWTQQLWMPVSDELICRKYQMSFWCRYVILYRRKNVNFIDILQYFYVLGCFWYIISYAECFYAQKQLLLSARLSHCNSVRLSVCPFVSRVDQSKAVQARITKFSLSAARKTLVSGTVKLFHKFEGGHPT